MGSLAKFLVRSVFEMRKYAMQWDIRSGKGVGPLWLGMSREQTEDAIGDLMPLSSHIEDCRTTFEHRAGRDLILRYKNSCLDIILITSSIKYVYFDEIDIFQIKPEVFVWDAYYKNCGALYSTGVLLFDKLQIGADGFYSENDGFYDKNAIATHDRRAVSVFDKEVVRNIISEYRPIEIMRP